MAKLTPRPTAKPAAARSTAPQRSPQEVVDPRWLLKMIGFALAAALVCGYLTLGLLFYLGSWQLVLHPTRLANSGTGLPTQHVQFSTDASGKPRLSGEWYPAEPGATRASYTVLYLRSGDGQLDQADGTQIATLHGLGLNVFAFDYTGYGSSTAAPHPSENQMLQDATAAQTYLTSTHNVPVQNQLLFGSSLGVSIAAQLAQQTPGIAALIAYNADPEVVNRVKLDARSKLFPLSLVFQNRFPLTALQSLKQPKLLYTVGPLNAARSAVYQSAADPNLTVEVPTHNADEERAAIARFINSYFSATPAQLQPH